MAASVGQLTIEMVANFARLQQDMDKATKSVAGAMQKIKSSAKTAMTALGAIGVGLTVNAFKNWISDAIDAADAQAKLSQKIGVSVGDLAGLQLAYRQSGAGAEALQKSMQQLSRSMADPALEGGQALAALDVQVQNTDGSLRSQRDVLADIADKMSGYNDGAEKTALAMAIFGKSGADLIPLLNAGSENLDSYDETARRLGLTLDLETAQSAERFNDTIDLVSQSSQGVARQIAAKLLPTLENLAGSFLNSVTQGDHLNKIAAALSTGLKGLYSVGVGIVQVFSSVGDTLGAVFAAVYEAMHGNFSGAKEILKMLGQDLEKSWIESANTIEKVWSDVGDETISTMVSLTQETKKAAPVVDALVESETKEDRHLVKKS